MFQLIDPYYTSEALGFPKVPKEESKASETDQNIAKLALQLIQMIDKDHISMSLVDCDWDKTYDDVLNFFKPIENRSAILNARLSGAYDERTVLNWYVYRILGCKRELHEGRIKILDYFLNEGASMELAFPGRTAADIFHESCMNKTLDHRVVAIWQKYIPSINVQGRFGLTGLHFAMAFFNENTSQYLLAQGADPSLRTTHDITVRMTVKLYNKGTEITIPAGKTAREFASSFWQIQAEHIEDQFIQNHRLGGETQTIWQPYILNSGMALQGIKFCSPGYTIFSLPLIRPHRFIDQLVINLDKNPDQYSRKADYVRTHRILEDLGMLGTTLTKESLAAWDEVLDKRLSRDNNIRKQFAANQARFEQITAAIRQAFSEMDLFPVPLRELVVSYTNPIIWNEASLT